MHVFLNNFCFRKNQNKVIFVLKNKITVKAKGRYG
uniref:Uncharacterized protein n=1 Tax=viral metagenome TaxID=1070528 RepID=A0A6C0AZK7_9ZZZZ